MNDAARTAESHPLGHNRRGELIAGDALELHLATTYSEIVERAKELLQRGPGFAQVASAEDDSASTEFLVKLRACYKWAEGKRVEEKEPYDTNAGIVHAFFKTRVLDPLTALGAEINRAQTAFKVQLANEERRRREEAERIAREEERQRREAAQRAEAEARAAEQAAARKRNESARAEAEAKAAELRARAEEARVAEDQAAAARAEAQRAAAAPAADLSRSRGERGGVSSLKAHLTFRDLDRATIDLEALRNYLPDKALEQAVKGWIDANKGAAQAAAKGGAQPLRGVTIFEELKSSGRA